MHFQNAVYGALSIADVTMKQRTSELLGPEPTPTVLALMAVKVKFEMIASYSAELERMVDRALPSSSIRINPKAVRSAQRRLASDEAFQVTAIIWKQSSYVSDKEIAAAGLARLNGILTSNSISRDLLPELAPQLFVQAKCARVQQIVKAAWQLGLIKKERLRPKLISLIGTEMLHEFMLNVGGGSYSAIGTTFPLHSCADEEAA